MIGWRNVLVVGGVVTVYFLKVTFPRKDDRLREGIAAQFPNSFRLKVPMLWSICKTFFDISIQHLIWDHMNY